MICLLVVIFSKQKSTFRKKGFWHHTRRDIVHLPFELHAFSHIFMVQAAQASWNSLLFVVSEEVNSLTSHVFALWQHCSTAAFTMMDVTSWTAASRRKTSPSSHYDPFEMTLTELSIKNFTLWVKKIAMKLFSPTALKITSFHVHPLCLFCWDFFCHSQACLLGVPVHSFFHSGKKKKKKKAAWEISATPNIQSPVQRGRSPSLSPPHLSDFTKRQNKAGVCARMWKIPREGRQGGLGLGAFCTSPRLLSLPVGKWCSWLNERVFVRAAGRKQVDFWEAEGKFEH